MYAAACESTTGITMHQDLTSRAIVCRITNVCSSLLNGHLRGQLVVFAIFLAFLQSLHRLRYLRCDK